MLKQTLVRALVVGLALAGALAPAATAATRASLRFGLVASTDGLFDGSTNQLAAAALRTSSLRLGALVDIRSSPSEASYVPSLQAMAAQGYDLVLAIGPSEASAVGQVARAYPNVEFAIVGGSYGSSAVGGLPNVEGLVFKYEQSGYVAGYLAGLVERAGGPGLDEANTIGTISGSLDPSATRTLAGFRAGARAADPRVKLLAGFSNADSNGARCSSLAASQIAHGADIVFPVAGPCGAGALAAAASAHVRSIGSRVDEAAVGPSLIASTLERADRVVELTVQAVADGTYVGGRDVEFGLAQGAVSLGPLPASLSHVIRVRVAAAAARVRAGRISIPTAPAPR